MDVRSSEDYSNGMRLGRFCLILWSRFGGRISFDSDSTELENRMVAAHHGIERPLEVSWRFASFCYFLQ